MRYKTTSSRGKFKIGLILMILGGILMPFGVSAFFEDFEDFDLGNLVGQGNWIQYNTYSIQVINSPVYQGNRAVKLGVDTMNEAGAKLNIAVEKGQGSFYVSRNGYGAGHFVLWDNSNKGFRFQFLWDGVFKFHCFYDNEYIEFFEATPNVWYKIGFNFDTTTNKFYFNIDDGDYTEVNCTSSEITTLNLVGMKDSGYVFIDDLNLSIISTIEILDPVSESTIDRPYDFLVEYDLKGEDFDKIMILFEDWDASSTCPAYDSEEYTEEYLKWFNYQSFPYFSDVFSTSSGTTTIKVSDLASGNYNCVRCYFVKADTISVEKCPGYEINVSVYIPPEEIPIYYLPITDWEEYYAEHSERYPTSTPLFVKMAEVFEPIISWVGNTALGFQSYFDPDEAKQKGAEMGNAIPVARGYLENIDNFFGGLPISTIFIFYIISALVVFVYRLVKGILTIIVP